MARTLDLYSQSIELEKERAVEFLHAASSEVEEQVKSLSILKAVWPEGEQVFTQIEKGIGAERKLLSNAEAWILLIDELDFSSGDPRDDDRYMAYEEKNRAYSAEAGNSVDHASSILFELTGLSLPEPEL